MAGFYWQSYPIYKKYSLKKPSHKSKELKLALDWAQVM